MRLGSEVSLCTGFQHPRVVFGNFEDSLLVLEEFVRRAYGGKIPLLRPRLLFHPLEALAGGLSAVEIHGLMAMGVKIGRQVEVIETANALTDAELQTYLTQTGYSSV